jgi:hypothetical protein
LAEGNFNGADMELIDEAGTITNQTNRTPAELAALVRELREASEMTLTRFESLSLTPFEASLFNVLKAALAKSEGV